MKPTKDSDLANTLMVSELDSVDNFGVKERDFSFSTGEQSKGILSL